MGDRRREIRVLLDPNRLNAYGLTVRAGRQPPSSGRTPRSPAAASSPARPRSRCAPWAGCATSASSRRSSSPTRTARSSRSATSRASPTRTRKSAARPGSTARTPSRCRSASSRAPTPSTVVDRVLARLERIQATLPSDIKRQADARPVARSSASRSRRSSMHLILGGVLAALVVFLFIRNLRVTIIAGAGHPDLDHRHLRGHAPARLHAEQHDDARAVAGDRHRHRRRDRRAREHLPLHRGEGGVAEAGGDRGDRGNRAGRHGDDAVAGRHLRARSRS